VTIELTSPFFLSIFQPQMESLRNNVTSPTDLINLLYDLDHEPIDSSCCIVSTICCLITGLYPDHVAHLNNALVYLLNKLHRPYDNDTYVKILDAVIRGFPVRKGKLYYLPR